MAQTKDYKVVFDLTSKDTVNQQAVVREVGLISKANPDARLEVVVYGQGLNLVLKDKSAVSEEINQLSGNKNVSFKVCGYTLQRNNVDKSMLLPGVEVVPDGIYEIITRQKEGWGYIKVAH
jgi:intracellular sulfur oxidation DsrE/DsrF family protein